MVETKFLMQIGWMFFYCLPIAEAMGCCGLHLRRELNNMYN